MVRPGSLGALFLELASPDPDGFSRRVFVKEFVGPYARLRLGNGGSWCRDDGPLAREFNIHRVKEKGAIVAVELHGLKKQPITKPIPRDIRELIVAQRCPVLNTSNPECDHKDGRRDDPRLNDPARVTVDDFQPLSKAANNAKRQHCRECRETGKRFDARTLGFAIAQTKGNGDYRGSCVGCYWHDVRAFHENASTSATATRS